MVQHDAKFSSSSYNDWNSYCGYEKFPGTRGPTPWT